MKADARAHRLTLVSWTEMIHGRSDGERRWTAACDCGWHDWTDLPNPETLLDRYVAHLAEDRRRRSDLPAYGGDQPAPVERDALLDRNRRVVANRDIGDHAAMRLIEEALHDG